MFDNLYLGLLAPYAKLRREKRRPHAHNEDFSGEGITGMWATSFFLFWAQALVVCCWRWAQLGLVSFSILVIIFDGVGLQPIGWQGRFRSEPIYPVKGFFPNLTVGWARA
jgi:hypothetical protein